MNQPILESPCCEAPSTTMNRGLGAHLGEDDRRCVRCQHVFGCAIEVGEDQEEVMRIRFVAEAQAIKAGETAKGIDV
jgi:hypothetical protein